MMQSFSLSLRRLDKNTIREWALIALWIAGSSLGLLAERLFGDAYASFLQPLAGTGPDLGGVFAAAIFPLLLSACAVFLWGAAGCYGMCLLRGVSQGLLLGLIRRCYGTAAPLVALLLAFSGLAVNAVLLFFWLRRLRMGQTDFQKDLSVMLGLGACIALTDHLLIGPFLADVINL